MTVIHGDIQKIYEIERDAYTEPLPGLLSIVPYSFGFTLGAGPGTLGYFTLTSTNFASAPFLLHSVNVSTNSTAIQRIFLIHYPAVTTLLHAYFRYDSQIQLSGGDVRIDLTDGSYIRLYFENNSVNPRYFEGTVWYTAPVS